MSKVKVSLPINGQERIADMEAAAKTFEQEDGILDENMYSYSLLDMFQRDQANGYTPNCELRLDSVVEFYTSPEQSTHNQEVGTQSQSEASCSAASTLCSLSEPVGKSAAPKTAEGQTILKLGIIGVDELGEGISNSTCESSLSPALYHESLAKLHDDLQRSDMKPMVDNESDDSDSGIFRVKRPSSLKAERRNMNAMY